MQRQLLETSGQRLVLIKKLQTLRLLAFILRSKYKVLILLCLNKTVLFCEIVFVAVNKNT